MTFLKSYPSQSTQGLAYDLFWNGTWYFCNCPGFKWNKKQPRACRHVEDYREKHGDPKPADPKDFEGVPNFPTPERIAENWMTFHMIQMRRKF